MIEKIELKVIDKLIFISYEKTSHLKLILTNILIEDSNIESII